MSRRAAIPTAVEIGEPADALAGAGMGAASGSDGSSAVPGDARRHRFAAVDADPSGAFAPVIELASFAAGLEVALTASTGLPCRVTSIDDAAPGDAEAATIMPYAAADGSRLGIALSPGLAEALVSHRCGGSLAVGDGVPGGAASVVRLHAELMAAILRIAAARWLPDGAAWSPAPATGPLSPPPLQAMTIHVGELRFPLGIAVVPAGAATAPDMPTAWAHDLRRSIAQVGFPVRAVLFETRLPLARAVQLRPGDVLPIETPREVGLRVGVHRLASGTIAPTDDGGHLVTIRSSARSFRQPSSEKAPL